MEQTGQVAPTPNESGPQPMTPNSNLSYGPEVVPVAPTPEVQAGSAEGANQNAGMPVLPTVMTPPPTPLTDNQAIAQVGQAQMPQIGKTPGAADDVDVIEREWVDKAKYIVESTKDDPYMQDKQIEALKVDYMKKRYGRDIKLTQD